jgi:uncharacterized protein YqeY
MSLRERLDADLKTAMKAGDSVRLSTIRLVKSEIRNTEIAKGSPLSDDDILQVIARENKKRRESIEQFTKAGRTDLADKEQAELSVLSEYLPKQLDEAEIENITREVMTELNAATKADTGRVMSAVMPKVRGRADGRLVKSVVDRLLGGSSG